MKLIDKNTASILAHSSMLIGEAVFTSLLYYNQRFIFLDEHLTRLLSGANFLFPEFNLGTDFVTELKKTLIADSKAYQDNRSVRITLTREGYFIDFRPWVENKAEISLGLSENRKIRSMKPHYLKLSNYALEFYELKKSKTDDLIYLDTEQNLTEATTSNLFIINSENQLVTPPASSTVLAGILRKKLIEYLVAAGFKVQEREIKIEEFLHANVVFLTNSIKGIRWINQFNEIKFEKSLMLEKIVNEFGRYGERINE